MTSRGVTFLLELRNLSKLSMHFGLVNFGIFIQISPEWPQFAVKDTCVVLVNPSDDNEM